MRVIHENALVKLGPPPPYLLQNFPWVYKLSNNEQFIRNLGYEIVRDLSPINNTARRWFVDSLMVEPKNHRFLTRLASYADDYVSDIDSVVNSLYQPQNMLEETSNAVRNRFFPKDIFSLDGMFIVSIRKEKQTLYDFQISISNKLQRNIENGCSSLVVSPTGSGKTKILVESLLNQIHKKHISNVFWLADRNILLNQTIDSTVRCWEDFSKYAKNGIDTIQIIPPNEISSLNQHSEFPTIRFQTVQYVDENLDIIQDMPKDCIVVIDEVHRGAERNLKLISEFKKNDIICIGMTATVDELNNMLYADAVTRLSQPIMPEGIISGNEEEFIKKGYIAETKVVRATDLFQLDIIDDQDLSKFEKNKLICEHIKENNLYPAIWFTESVDEAKIVAAIGETLGINSTHLSGQTNKKMARSIIQDFEKGNYQLLSNADLLSAGFNVPSVKCVILDKNVDKNSAGYKQMVGRGRRGIKMGGHPVCVVIEVVN